MPGRYTREGDVRDAADDDRRHVRDREARRRDRACVRCAARLVRCPTAGRGRFSCWPTASARRWTSTRRAPTSVEPLPFHAHDRVSLSPRRSVTPIRRTMHSTGERYNTRVVTRACLDRNSVELVSKWGERWRTSAIPPPPARPTMPNPVDRRQMRANTDRMLSDDRFSAWPAARRFCRCGSSCSRNSPTPRRCSRRVEELLAEAGGADPERAHRPPDRQGARARPVHPERLDARRGSAVAGRRASTRRCLIGPDGILSKYRKVNPWIPYEVHSQPARPARLRRAAVSGGRHADRQHRLRDLLRLAVPGGDPSAGGERRRGAGPRVGLHGSVGRHRADGLVDDHQSRARDREHGLRGRREPGRAACGTIRRTRGRAARRWSISTAACSPTPRRDPASGSSSRPSTSRRCATSGRRRVGHHMLAHLRTEAYEVYPTKRLPARRARCAVVDARKMFAASRIPGPFFFAVRGPSLESSPPMPVSVGARLGPHEVLAPLGAGGMGEVYARAGHPGSIVTWRSGPAGSLPRGSQASPASSGEAQSRVTEPSAHRPHPWARGISRRPRARHGARRG